MTEQRCHSVLHTHTRPTLGERCKYDEGHLGPHSFDWKDGKWRWGAVTDLEQDYEEAELETPGIDEETWTNRHWLLIVGVGLVGIGLLIRWWLRRK